MSFIWPSMLVFLLALPLLVAWYLRSQQRRTRLVEAFGAGSTQQFARREPGRRRHLPALLFLLSVAILLLALARPQAEVQIPRVEGTVMLVVDVSGSMAAADAEPSRLEAAKALAREFVQSQPASVQIGIVSFSGSGFAVQNPTNDLPTLVAAIDRLRPQTGTSLGMGILAALQAIAVDAGLTPEVAAGATQSGAEPNDQDAQASPDVDLLAQIPEGSFPASVIVLLTDGENNMSLDPVEAALAAAERDVRIDAVGFGSPGGVDLEVEGFTVHTALDEAALQAVTQAAGGAYYNAQSQADLQAIYSHLTPELVIKPEQMEVTSIFAGAGILVMLVGAVFSLLWFSRLP